MDINSIELPPQTEIELPQVTYKTDQGQLITLPKAYDEQLAMERVLIASKTVHKGQLFGHISAGGGSIVIGPNLSLRIMSVGDDFRTIEVFQHGIGIRPVSSNYQQKKVIVKMPDKPVQQTFEVKSKVEEAEQAW